MMLRTSITPITRLALLALLATLPLACGETRAIAPEPDGQVVVDGCAGERFAPGGDLAAPDAQTTCPVERPASGAPCGGPAGPVVCSYWKGSGCPCGPVTIAVSCACSGSAWSCTEEACAPCMDAGVDQVLCPPLPACNWCGGDPNHDAQGCVTGWTCANGADPCATQPCSSDGDCLPSESCASDGLCWSTIKLDAGGAP